MAMKQTQTKIFDFSDAGLDFCSGSKNLFPDRFKKMLALGYNTQTVSSVAVSGNQVTLTYGVSHGYVADRVLKIISGALAAINGGEFVIDSVTTNTVTMTIDDAPTSIVGNFTTYIAPLGYELVYDVANIHIYKMKALDESDLYLRLCFQNNSAYRNRVSPCVGKTANLVLGIITDTDALSTTINCTSPVEFAWEYSLLANATYNNHTYAAGYSLFGKGMLVGSKYHVVTFGSLWTSDYSRINAVLPCSAFNYPMLGNACLMGESALVTGNANGQQKDKIKIFLGNVSLKIQGSNILTFAPSYNAAKSFLPSNIDNFNTTTCAPILLYEQVNGQFIGAISGGLYSAQYGTAIGEAPTTTNSTSPLKTIDVDFSTICYVHSIGSSVSNNFFVAPIEEIKHGT